MQVQHEGRTDEAAGGERVPLNDLAAAAGVPPHVLILGARMGHGGCRLVAVWEPERGWCATPGAVVAFLEARAAADAAAKPAPPPPQAPKPRRSRADIAAAVARLNEEELVPVANLTKEARASQETLRRWVILGRRGVFLDGVHRPQVGWMTSRAALARFFDASPADAPTIAKPR